MRWKQTTYSLGDIQLFLVWRSDKNFSWEARKEWQSGAWPQQGSHAAPEMCYVIETNLAQLLGFTTESLKPQNALVPGKLRWLVTLFVNYSPVKTYLG